MESRTAINFICFEQVLKYCTMLRCEPKKPNKKTWKYWIRESNLDLMDLSSWRSSVCLLTRFNLNDLTLNLNNPNSAAPPSNTSTQSFISVLQTRHRFWIVAVQWSNVTQPADERSISVHARWSVHACWSELTLMEARYLLNCRVTSVIKIKKKEEKKNKPNKTLSKKK